MITPIQFGGSFAAAGLTDQLVALPWVNVSSVENTFKKMASPRPSKKKIVAKQPVASKRTRPKKKVEGTHMLETYAENDILQGRGKGFSRHPGNRRFRKIVKRYTNEYAECQTNGERKVVVNRVLAEVKEKGRFVQLCDETDGTCFLLAERKIREKVSQALRYQHRTQAEGLDVDSQSGSSSVLDEVMDNIEAVHALAQEAVPSVNVVLSDHQLFHGNQRGRGTVTAPHVGDVSRETDPLVTDEEVFMALGAYHLVNFVPERSQSSSGSGISAALSNALS